MVGNTNSDNNDNVLLDTTVTTNNSISDNSLVRGKKEDEEGEYNL
jgi:hypothetical protein